MPHYFNIMKKFILISISIWLIGILVGISIDNVYVKDHEQVAIKLQNLVKNESFISVFYNNWILITILHFGFISIGLITIGTLFYNGFIFGCMYNFAFKILSFKQIALSTLPHFIEVIAIIISGSFGLKQSLVLINWLNKQDFILHNEFEKNLKHYFFMVFVIFIAAAIEMTISISI